MARLQYTREAALATMRAAQEFEQAGFTSAADALKDAALRMDAAIRRDEAVLRTEEARARAVRTAAENRSRALARGTR